MKNNDISNLFFYCKYHLNNVIVQEIMLLIEYLPIIVISIASPTLISQYYQYPSYQSVFSHYFFFKIQIILNITSNVNFNLLISLIPILFVSILGYHLIPYLFNTTIKDTNWKYKLFNHFSSFYYDLFFLRTANHYIIYLCFSLFIYSLNESSSKGYYYFIAFIIIILLIWYIIQVYKHIRTNCVILHLENKSISPLIINYPHDWCFSMHHDIIMLGLKIICTIEMCCFNSLTMRSIQFVMFSFNSIISLYIVLYCLYLGYYTLIHIRLEWFIFNRLFVFIRIGIVLFILYSIIFHLLFLNSSSSNSLILSIMLMSLIWSFISIWVLWKMIIQRNLFNGEIQLIKMLFALCTTTNTSLFKVDSSLINSFELEYNIIIKSKSSSSKSNKSLFLIQNPLMYLVMIYHICKYFRIKSNKYMRKSIDYIYFDIIQLLYYSTKGKILQYFIFSNIIINKYSSGQQAIIANAHLLVNTFLSTFKDNDNLSVFTNLFKEANLYHIIDSALISMKELIQSPKEMMKPIIFYDLSNEINKLKSFARSIVNKVELNDNKNMNDLSTHNLIQVNNYCLLIHRYLIETLTNEVLIQDSRLDIDLLKEFLSFHFMNDKTLLFSTPLSSSLLNEKVISSATIIKCGHEMIKYKGHSMAQIFPSKFRSEGIKLFSQKLFRYVNEDSIKENNTAFLTTTTLNTPFQFVMNSSVSSYVDLFVYSFKIIPSIVKKNEMIINGTYSSNDKIIIIFKEESNGELILETYSPSVQNLLIICAEWVEFLKSHNIVITFDELFHKWSVKHDRDNNQDFECQFNYQIFLNHLLKMPNFDDLMQLFSKKNPTIDLKAKLFKSKEKKFNVVYLQLYNLFTIMKRHRYFVYSIVVAKGLNSIRKSLKANEEFDNDNEDIFNMYQTMNTMNNSLMSSTTVSTSELLKKRKAFGKYSNKISETFLKFSTLILVFLCFIIIVCIIFLIIQIIQSQSLYKVNTLYYQFKTLQIFFSHSFLNVFSNICIAEQKTDACSNAYQDYSKTMQEVLNLPQEYSTRDYVVNAIGFLINNLKSIYNGYNDNIHSYGDQTLIDILLTKMNYIMIKQLDNDIEEVVIQITLEEGLQKFINSLTILDQAKNSFDAQEYTVHIISVKLLNVNFDNVLTKKNLNEVQIEVYKICMNYINYSSGFLNGESKLINLYNNREDVKKKILLIYIIIVLILHAILAILCRWILIIVQKLLTSIISEIINELYHKEINSYLVTKVDILSTLNKLYIKNPNHLFKNLGHARKEFIKSCGLIKGKKDNQSDYLNHHSNNDNKTENHLQSAEKNSLIKQKEMKKLLIPVLIKVYSLFISFFGCVIVFNVFLLNSFSDVMIINNYVLAHIRLESQLYDNIALPQIMTLINLTQTELAIQLGMESIPEDGVLNMKIRQGSEFKKLILNQEQKYPTMFPPISSYFNYNCTDIFNAVSDNVTISVGKYLNVNYLLYQIRLCEKFRLTHLDNFEFMYNEHNLRSQLLQDYLKTFSYDELYNFNEQFDFFDIFTLTILIIRPLKYYINEKILYKKIDNAFKQFIIVISGYLTFNIIADVIIFLIIKIVVLGKINAIHLNFLCLNKCFSVSKAILNSPG